MNLAHLSAQSDANVRALFGLTPKALGELLAVALPELLRRREEAQRQRPGRKLAPGGGRWRLLAPGGGRWRLLAPGGGRRRLLAPYQEALLTLVYLRHNVAFGVVGPLFGVSADVAENPFHEVVPVLGAVCPSERFAAQKRWQKGEPSWQPGPIDRVLLESFETPVPRPSEPTRQRRLYSGKKKRHTQKTQVAADGGGELLALDLGYRGPTSDKRLYEASGAEARLPPAPKLADPGYLGLPTVATPPRKPRGGERTQQQREPNRLLASQRVRVEHCLRRLKGFGVLRGVYRLATGLFPRVAFTVAGLVQLQRLAG